MTTVNLNEATHANHYSYSDVTHYEIVKKVSEKTIEVRRMKYELINKEDLKFHVGGFAAHCSNLHDQKYTYESDENEEVIRLRLRKDGLFYDKYGNRYKLSTRPVRFYDYNFWEL